MDIMLTDSYNNDTPRLKNEYMRSGSSGSVGNKPHKSGAKESVRSAESADESRDISRSRRARAQARPKVQRHPTEDDATLQFDAAVKFYLCKVLSKLTFNIEKLDTYGQFSDEYYATATHAYAQHHERSDEGWAIGLPVLKARVKSYQYDCVHDYRLDFRAMVSARLRAEAEPPFSAEYQSMEELLHEGLTLLANYEECVKDKTVQQHYTAHKGRFEAKPKHVIAAILDREHDARDCLLCGEERTRHSLECKLCRDTYHTACMRMIDKRVPDTNRHKWHCDKCQLLVQQHQMRQYLRAAAAHASPQSPQSHHGTLTAFTLNLETSQNKPKKRKRSESDEDAPPQKKPRVTHRTKLPRATQQTVDPDKIANNKEYARTIKWEPVDRVVGRRLCNKIVQYKVLWRAKPIEESKWVYHYQMQDCDEFVRQFETKFASLIEQKRRESEKKRQREQNKS